MTELWRMWCRISNLHHLTYASHSIGICCCHTCVVCGVNIVLCLYCLLTKFDFIMCLLSWAVFCQAVSAICCHTFQTWCRYWQGLVRTAQLNGYPSLVQTKHLAHHRQVDCTCDPEALSALIWQASVLDCGYPVSWFASRYTVDHVCTLLCFSRLRV